MDQETGKPEDIADDAELFAVHMCVTCSHEIRRSEMEAQALISGVVECPICGDAGALNIVIRSHEDKKPPKRSTDQR